MKFRNKETGEIFDSFGDARRSYCNEKTGSPDECRICPISGTLNDEAKNPWVSCTNIYENDQFVRAACGLIGFEIVDDEDAGQEAKADAGKPRPTLVPTSLIRAVMAIREYGCAKYHDPENWRQVEPQRYRDAAYRHWLAYLDDPHGVDAESGLPHLWHLACNIAFLIEMEGNQHGTEKA